MNIESASSATTNATAAATVTNTNAAKVENTTNKDGNSFKDELKVQDKKTETKTSTAVKEKEVENETAAVDKNTVENKEKTAEQEKNATKNNLDKKQTMSMIKSDDEELYNSISELNKKIETMTELNSMKIDQMQGIVERNQYLDTSLNEKSELCKTISLDKTDATFFLNLVDNQTMTAQGMQSHDINSHLQQMNFTEVKAEALQKTVDISPTLLNALNESMQTNKPFRIDFDKDVAVIMKVDRNGVLSANFIPGSTAGKKVCR